MAHTIKPPYHLARAHLERGVPDAIEPPPSNDEVRRQLGTALINAERQTRAERDERS